MKITRDNYEAFLLDHIEGNLSEEESALLLAFLDENPDLDADFDLDLEGIQETVPPVGVIETDSLLSHNDQVPETVEFWLAKRLEGEPDALDTPINDPATQKEWEIMQKTRLEVPKESFLQKRDLLIPPFIASFDEWKAAVAEGDIQGRTAEAWKTQEPAEFAAFTRTKLRAPEVAYGDTAGLQRTGKVIPLYRFAYRAAAVAAAILVVFFIGQTLNSDPLTGDRLMGETVGVEANRTPFAAQPAVNTGDGSENQASQKVANTTSVSLAHSSTSEESFTRPEGRKSLPMVTLAALPLQEIQTRKIESMDLLTEGQQAMLNSEQGTDMAYQETIEWQDFMLREAKKKVLGRDQQEDETFLEAVAERLEDRTDGQVAFATNEDDKGFYFRLGKLEISR